jgi:MoaA/NifB/PqqE/SkfB family radical SAM enzyme
MSENTSAPFCSQPWSTIYVQWDGKLTRPCIRGPQNLGSVENTSLLEFWNGPSFSEAREQVRDQKNMKAPCESCYNERSRLIDHLTPFSDNINGFSREKIVNYYKAQANFNIGFSVIDSGPTVVVLDMGSKCNIRCPKCFVYNSGMQYSLGNMTMETFNNVVPILKTALLVVGHENGESILNRNFLEMIRIIKANGCRFTFNTTGQTLTEKKSQHLVAQGVDQIMFSIDSLDKEIYEYMHKGGTLARLMENLNTLNSIKEKVESKTPLLGWYFVASRSNYKELPTIVERAFSLGFNSMYVSTLNKPTPEQWDTYYKYYDYENLISSDVDLSNLRDSFSVAQQMASERGIKFFSGPVG